MHKLLKKSIQIIRKRDQEQSNPYIVFGWFGVITYPGYYLIWHFTSLVGDESFYLRLVATILCIPFILKNYWPPKIKPLLPFYWHIVLIYCLPFLFTFFLLKNNFTYAYILNTLSVLTLSILLIDVVPLILCLSIGIPAGFLAFYLTSGKINLPNNLEVILISYLSVIIVGALFARSKETIHQAKLNAIKITSASMAHELRTPLRTISSNLNGLKKYLPILFDAHQKAQQAKLDVAEIEHAQYRILYRAINNIETEAEGAFTIINMLMVVAGMSNSMIDKEQTSTCSMTACIQTALDRYPFDLREQELIYWPAVGNKVSDFQFRCKELLIVHIIFNLLKNALYHIKAAGKGEIYIWLEPKAKHNLLHFRDTGTGIPAKKLKCIFDQFYTDTLHGSGIGLAFCKMAMQSLNGEIKCLAEEGKYSEFILYFPQIK